MWKMGLTAALALGVVSTTPAPVYANDGKVELSGLFSAGLEGGEVITPRISAFVPISSGFALSGDIGLGVLTGDDDDDGADVLNTYIAGHILGDLGVASYRVGFGVAIPSARDGAPATADSSAPRGLTDLWIYSPDTWSLVVPARVEMDAGIVTIAGDGALVLYIPEEGSTDFGFQVAGEVAVSLGIVGLGARLQLASVPTGDGDRTQVSLYPFIQAQFVAVYARLGLFYNLDEPFGPSLDDDRNSPAGVEAAVGITW